jgi:hypothetical protein
MTATRFAAAPRPVALAVVIVVLAGATWLVSGAMTGASAGDGTSAGPGRNGGDVACFKRIVERLRGGESYYDVAEAEMRRQEFPLWPAFNWRQPTCAWLMARLPSPLWGNALLALASAAVVWAARRWASAGGLPASPALVTVLVAVSLSPCLVRDFVYMSESWAGVLVALSVCLAAIERPGAAVAAGLAALAFREFALLPCLVSAALAARRRRWREVALWAGGLAAYALLLRAHHLEVARHLRPGDVSRGWLAFGGARFLVATSKWSPFFVALPDTAVALGLPLAALGLGGIAGDAGARAALVVLGYLCAFAFVGNWFNDYWGAMYAPLLPFGLLTAPAAARDLRRALRGP